MAAAHDFTPGPWEVGHMGKRVVGYVRHGGMHGALQSTVAECEREADARLIATTLELADALRSLIDDSWSDISNQPCVPSKSTVEAARAALAKAGL